MFAVQIAAKLNADKKDDFVCKAFAHTRNCSNTTMNIEVTEHNKFTGCTVFNGRVLEEDIGDFLKTLSKLSAKINVRSFNMVKI